ncbi:MULTISPECIES: hypothetical protein [Enterobacter]|uniref:hypothetical protein n=1 Tax=Enterobacter TaxID=547 RepID=UPI000650B6E4|nr:MULTISPECIES: hypothetical protein [Enterobacter]EIT7317861.1 hypothetical protein [Enterobacter hormaechei]EKS6332231.1 hypothetical protein [Enterobacter hormaechei]EKS6509700.1 hypothetical protein [Enterobacter hormaechei]EKT4032269.1 hypothetical protein [Enterobacter hormaechei]EKZ1441752.1 hypothetical protein [Enterobacter hormaechei]
MHRDLVFKNKNIFVLFMLATIGYGIWRMLGDFFYLEQTIVYRHAVADKSMLYITESSAGATTSFVYKYYLYTAQKTDEVFLEDIKNGYEPFLVTTDPGVKVSIEDRTIFLKVNGDIFKFNNIVGSAFIYLNSSPF